MELKEFPENLALAFTHVNQPLKFSTMHYNITWDHQCSWAVGETASI